MKSLIDTRDGRKSTVVISQFPVSTWFDMFADNTYADACLTRITDKLFEDKNCVEFLLQIILKRDDLKVTSVSSQYVIKNLQGRSVRLDILAVDRQNQVYNIEIQRDDKGAGVKRARYNSSLIDANVTEPGEQYQNLNETYVVFITENDVLGENIPIYHVDRIVRETGKMFNDQSHIIYVNSQIKDETALGKLKICTTKCWLTVYIILKKMRKEWQLCVKLWKI